MGLISLDAMRVPGYELTAPIYEGAQSAIFKAHRADDPSASVIIKTHGGTEMATVADIARLRHEYNILCALAAADVQSVPRPVALVAHANGLAMVVSDFDGVSLRDMLREGLDRGMFLAIAIEACKALAFVHRAGIIHKDIKPANLKVNPRTMEVQVIDFSISTRLAVEDMGANQGTTFEGSLAYMSPEQTGRMNRQIDFRTDFYSLGVTFYEMLAGRLPFAAKDAIEYVHCHIAKTPKPLHAVDATIPRALSDIVAKLMAKTAEDRYQSAQGVLADLELCLARMGPEWPARSPASVAKAMEGFVAGQVDRRSQFVIPQKLYGREDEVGRLMAAYQRVAMVGSVEACFVSGFSGIGKSSIVNEVHKPIVAARGRFAGGKFDQFRRQKSALLQALGDLVNGALSEGEYAVAGWRQRMNARLGAHARIIVEIVPELEHLVGATPPVAQLPPAESQNRFERVFRQFVGAFCSAEYPLVIFLDDLQWVDPASLRLVHILLTDPQLRGLLLIGAYRDNEVSPDHPFVVELEGLRRDGLPVTDIVITPLRPDHVRALVRDTLDVTVSVAPSSSGHDGLDKLASLLHDRTGGNPFFVTQLFKSLYDDGLIAFDFGANAWAVDTARLAETQMTSNVVDLMVSRVRRLPAPSQDLLRVAAAVGARFTARWLAIACDQPIHEVGRLLWPALEANLIVPFGGDYNMLVEWEGAADSVVSDPNVRIASFRFQHDRVQQAAYTLIPEDEKAAVHLAIGQRMCRGVEGDPKALDPQLLEIVNQLNAGRHLVTDPAERTRMARLNFQAGQKAFAATAYVPAVAYHRHACTMLPAEAWESQFDACWEMTMALAAAEYVTSDFVATEATCETLLRRATTALQRASVLEILLGVRIQQNRLRDALDIGLAALGEISVPLRMERPTLSTLEELMQTGDMTDPVALTAMRILAPLIGPTYALDTLLNIRVAFTMVHLTQTAGLSALAPFAYVFYGLVASNFDLPSGLLGGQRALELFEKRGLPEQRGKVLGVFHYHVAVWHRPIRSTIEPLHKAFAATIEAGDIEFSGYTAFYVCDAMLFAGDPLRDVAKWQEKYFAGLVQRQQLLTSTYFNIWRRHVIKLLHGEWDEEYEFFGRRVTDDLFIEELVSANTRVYAFAAYLARGTIAYHLGKYADAVEDMRSAHRFFLGAVGMMPSAIYAYQCSLAVLALARSLRGPGAVGVGSAHDPGAREMSYEEALSDALALKCPPAADLALADAVAVARANQRLLWHWAKSCPANFAHMHDLVEAAICWTTGRHDAAEIAFASAIRGASESGFLKETALASELSAEFYRDIGDRARERQFAGQAYYGYMKWGSRLVLRRLETTWPDFDLSREVPGDVVSVSSASSSRARSREQGRSHASKRADAWFGEVTTGSGSNDGLDMDTFLKASMAISSEIVMDALIKKLMAIVLENACGDRAVLLLVRDGELCVQSVAAIMEGGAVDVAVESDGLAVSSYDDMPKTIVNYVLSTKAAVVLDQCDSDAVRQLAADPYFRLFRPKSVMCSPILCMGQVAGMLYLENSAMSGVFHKDRLELISVLSSQLGVSLRNAQLFQEIRENSGFLEGVLEHMQDAILVLDSQLCVTLANRCFYERFMLEPDDVVGIPLINISDGDWNIPAFRVRLESLLTDETQNIRNFEIEKEFRYGRSCLLVNASRFSKEAEGGAPLVLVTVYDVTDRKRMAELELLAKDLARMIEDANVPIFGVDANDCVNEWNRKAAWLTGFSAHDVMGRSLTKDIIQDEGAAEKLRMVFRRAYVGEGTTGIEIRLPTKTGVTIELSVNASPRVDQTGNVVGVLCVGQDVTDRRRGEGTLKEGVVHTLASYLPRMVVDKYARDPQLPREPPVAETFTGSALFVDVSGFTPLTSRLAMEAVDGAEQVGRLLNGNFDRLIPVIIANGGDVVKFAGDAILAVFRTSEEVDLKTSALYAIQCGLALRDSIESGETPLGMTLPMKVGIGVGDFQAVHFGGVNDVWQCLVLGPPLAQMAAAEQSAKSGQVVVSRETWAIVQDRCTGQALADSPCFAVQSLMDPLQPHPPEPMQVALVMEPSLRAYVNPEVLPFLYENQTSWMTELRAVTSVFARASGFDYATSVLAQPDLVRLQSMLVAVQHILADFGGSMSKVLVDDKGLVFHMAFGLPGCARGNDVTFAVLAMCVMRDTLAQMGVGLSIGITTGVVFCGAIGTSTRREYTQHADVVNVAARFMTTAGPNEILCDNATRMACSEAAISFEGRGRVRLKGKTEEIEVFRPHQRRQATMTDDIVRVQHRLHQHDEYLQGGQLTPDAEMPFLGRRLLFERMDELMSGKHESDILPGETSSRGSGFQNDSTESRDDDISFRGVIAYRDMVEGANDVVVLEGATGIGKSEVLRQLYLRHLGRDAGTVLWTGQQATQPVERYFSLRAWRPILHQIFDLTSPAGRRSVMAQLHDMLDSVVPGTGKHAFVIVSYFAEEETKASFLASAMRELLQDDFGSVCLECLATIMAERIRSLAENDDQFRRTLILIDDYDVLGDDTSGLLHALTSVPCDAVFVITTRAARAGDVMATPGRTRRIHSYRLKGLCDADIVARVCVRLKARELSPELSKWLLDSSEGSPQVADVLVCRMRASGDVVICDGRAAWSESATVKLREGGIVQSTSETFGLAVGRIDGLNASQRTTLKVASIIGEEFSFDLLRHLLANVPGGTRIFDDLEALENLCLVKRASKKGGSLTYRFVSPLIQRVAYEMAPYSQRKMIHRDIAMWYEHVFAHDLQRYHRELAYHWGHTDDPAREVEFLIRSGLAVSSPVLQGLVDEEVALTEELKALEKRRRKVIEARRAEQQRLTAPSQK